MATQFKFVELSTVTDETIEDCVNEWVGMGWELEGIRFVTTEHSKRPSMAFVSFTREALPEVADREAPRAPRPLVADAEQPGSRGDGGDADAAADPFVIVAAGGNDVD